MKKTTITKNNMHGFITPEEAAKSILNTVKEAMKEHYPKVAKGSLEYNKLSKELLHYSLGGLLTGK